MLKLTDRWFVFAVTVAVHAAATGGRLATSPDSRLYIRLADSFFAGGAVSPLGIQKIVYLALLAAARALSPGHWMGLMIAVNLVSSGAVAVMLVDLVRRASRSAAAPVVALIFYLACYEIVQWLRFVLTDPLFSALAFIPFYLLGRRILIEGEPLRPLLLTISILLAAFTRPPGFLLIPLVLFGEVALVRRRVRVKTAVAILAIAAAAVLVVRSAVFDDPARWPFAFGKKKIVQFSAAEKKGAVVDDRRETYAAPVHSALGHAGIVAKRFGRFFQFTTSGYSRAHNLMNAVYFTPLYLLGAMAVWDAFRGGSGKRRALVTALLVWLGAFAFFWALSLLDFDWRYRAPLMPHFIALAACGAEVWGAALRRAPRRAG